MDRDSSKDMYTYTTHKHTNIYINICIKGEKDVNFRKKSSDLIWNWKQEKLTCADLLTKEKVRTSCTSTRSIPLKIWFARGQDNLRQS